MSEHDPYAAIQNMAELGLKSMLGLDQYEYARVPWDEVNARAKDGWQLMEMQPVSVYSEGQWNQLYVMQRQILASESDLDQMLGSGNA